MLPVPVEDPFARRQEPVGIAHLVRASSSGPRMGPAVDVPDPFAGEVRVQLRGGDTRMPEQLLDDTQVRAALEQMRRERVAQRVRTHPPFEPGARRGAADGGPCLLPGEPSSAVPEEQWTATDGLDVMEFDRHRAWPRDPAREVVDRHLADRHKPLLVALADDPYERAVERQVLPVESDRLADP